MPTLATLQKRFAEALVSGKGEGPLAGRLVGGGRLDARKALAVYRRGYAARLTAALGETYEACWWVLGDAAFMDACAAYIRHHPSAFYNLSDYGADFPAFLARRPEAREFPFLRELAAFEWAFKELFHAPEDASAPADQAGTGRLRFVSQMRLLRHHAAVYEVWKRRGGRARSLPPKLWDRPERLLLAKAGGDIRVWRLGEAESELLELLAAGRTLDRALGAVLARCPELDEARVAALFTLIGAAGLLRRAP